MSTCIHVIEVYESTYKKCIKGVVQRKIGGPKVVKIDG